MPGTVSANSRKLRVVCGRAAMSCRVTNWLTAGVCSSAVAREPVTTIAPPPGPGAVVPVVVAAAAVSKS